MPGLWSRLKKTRNEVALNAEIAEGGEPTSWTGVTNALNFGRKDQAMGAQNGKRLDVGAAVFAMAAAIFWFLSASGKLPPM